VARLGELRTTFAPHFLEFFGRRAVDPLFLRVRVYPDPTGLLSARPEALMKWALQRWAVASTDISMLEPEEAEPEIEPAAKTIELRRTWLVVRVRHRSGPRTPGDTSARSGSRRVGTVSDQRPIARVYIGCAPHATRDRALTPPHSGCLFTDGEALPSPERSGGPGR